jgi:hypothetical protein
MVAENTAYDTADFCPKAPFAGESEWGDREPARQPHDPQVMRRDMGDVEGGAEAWVRVCRWCGRVWYYVEVQS